MPQQKKMELPFIVRRLISGFIMQCKPLQEKENEWTHLQTCCRLSKCQIRPNLSCLDEWRALGRVSLRLLSFPHKKVRIPHERRSLPDWSQSCCFIHRKNWALRSLWQSSCGILWCGLSMTKSCSLPWGLPTLKSSVWLHMPKFPVCKTFFRLYFCFLFFFEN